MARIRIDTDTLQRCSASLQSHIANFEGYNGRLTDLVANIGSTWDGESSAAYQEMMLSYSGLSNRMVGILRQYLEYIQQAQQRFETLDSQCSSRIRGSF